MGWYNFTYRPPAEGTFNLTVTFASGLRMSAAFVVKDIVTREDINELYNLFNREFAKRDARIAELERQVEQKTTIAIGIAVVGVMAVLILANRARKLLDSAADKETARIIGVLVKEIEAKLKRKAQ